MTDGVRNVRTLIICFVIALSGLVFLRIFGVDGSLDDKDRVLGESKEEVVVSGYNNGIEIVLPEVGGAEY